MEVYSRCLLPWGTCVDFFPGSQLLWEPVLLAVVTWAPPRFLSSLHDASDTSCQQLLCNRLYLLCCPSSHHYIANKTKCRSASTEIYETLTWVLVRRAALT